MLKRIRKAEIKDLKARLAALERLGGNSNLIETVGRGGNLNNVVVQTVRHLVEKKSGAEARAFCQSLFAHENGDSVGPLAMGVYLALNGYLRSADGYFTRVDVNTAAAVCPAEFSDARLSRGTAEAAQEVLGLGRDLYLSGNLSGAFSCVKSLKKHGFLDESLSLFADFSDRSGLVSGLSEQEKLEVEWTQKVIRDRESTVTPDCDVIFGLMDYKLLANDRTSANIGDYVQTLSALGNILRHENMEIVSDDEALSKAVCDFQARMPEANRIKNGANVRVGVVPIDRDFASGRHYSKPVWFISNGWFMHANGRGKFDFPFPDYVRPIFVSFHINHHEFLTPEAIQYLKKYEPIGCRDWPTVYQLMDVGVEAFFSGCLTTTVGLLFKNSKSEHATAIANVEAKLTATEEKNPNVESFIQLFDGVRDYSLSDGLIAADIMLENYRKFSKIITSRLHCYLPCRSLGLDVKFRPKAASDIRFEGLDELDADAFDAMRNGLQEKLAIIVQMLLSGRDEDEIWTAWRRICAPSVNVAKQRVFSEPALTMTRFDTKNIVEALNKTEKRFGLIPKANSVELAFSIDDKMIKQLQITIASVLRHTQRHVSITVLSRDIDVVTIEGIAEKFPSVAMRFIDCSAVTYGDVHLLSHISISTMDRLFLPELYVDCKRIIYLDVDLIVRSDISTLFDMDISGYAIAGRKTTSLNWRNGLGLLELNAKKQDGLTAQRMRRWAYSTGKVRFDAINAGVLILDPNQLKADQFTPKTLAMVEAFGFHDQDAINFYCRDQRALLDLSWNFVPTQDYCEAPSIVHWAGPSKPWQELYTLYKEDYEALAETLG